MSCLVVETPAKVNWVLDVLSRRADGFHEIHSLMMAVGLYDRLEFQTLSGGKIEVVCDAPGVPSDSRNLVYRAAEALRCWGTGDEAVEQRGVRKKGAGHAQKKKAGRGVAGEDLGCRILLEKRIPVGGGMGGGSSDAAATLKALNDLWGLGLSGEALAKIGSGIGADVPFFFAGSGAIVNGVGDIVQPVLPAWSGWVVLVYAGMHVSTKDVYARCQPLGLKEPVGEARALVDIPTAAMLRPHLRNGLEEAVIAVAPRVGEMRDAVSQLGARPLRISGAGSVVFDLFDDEREAHAFAERARRVRQVHDVRVVEAPGRMRVASGECNDGNQRRASQTDW